VKWNPFMGEADEAPTIRCRRDDPTARMAELTEAVTALGFLLAAAHRELRRDPTPTEARTREAIERGMEQFRRASRIIREMHHVPRR
jgi:hypothetical protein